MGKKMLDVNNFGKEYFDSNCKIKDESIHKHCTVIDKVVSHRGADDNSETTSVLGMNECVKVWWLIASFLTVGKGDWR